MPLPPDALSRLLTLRWAALVAWVGHQYPWSEDVVQQAFIKLSTIDPVPANPSAWLFTTSRRLALNQIRSDQRRLTREAEYNQFPPYRSCREFDAERAELMTALQNLPDISRQIVVARIWGELSFDAIAESLEISKSTVWRTYEQSLEQLRQFYESSAVEANQ